jgi:hypothetical protein
MNSSSTYRSTLLSSAASSPSSSPVGLGLLGGAAETSHIQHTIQHVCTFRISDRWEKPIKRYMDKFLDLSLYYAESFRFISVGIGSFFFLWGVSKVVAAGNSRDDDVDGNRNDVHVVSKSSSSKSKSRSTRKGASDNATVTTQTSRTTTRHRRRTTPSPQSDADEIPPPPTTIVFESIDERQESGEVDK